MMRISLAVVLYFSVSSVQAGLMIDMVKRDPETGAVSRGQRIQVQNGAGRFEDEDGSVMIVRDGVMQQMDTGTKTYQVFDKAFMAKLKVQMAEAQKQMQASMANMPAEQRAMMEQMMGKMMPGAKVRLEAVDVKKTDKVDGRVCRVWKLMRGKQMEEEWCVVSYADLPAKGELQALMSSMATFADAFVQAVPGVGDEMMEDMRMQGTVDGFPVRMRRYKNGKQVAEEDVLKSWKEQSLPADIFQIPADYKRVEAMQPLGN